MVPVVYPRIRRAPGPWRAPGPAFSHLSQVHAELGTHQALRGPAADPDGRAREMPTGQSSGGPSGGGETACGRSSPRVGGRLVRAPAPRVPARRARVVAEPLRASPAPRRSRPVRGRGQHGDHVPIPDGGRAGGDWAWGPCALGSSSAARCRDATRARPELEAAGAGWSGIGARRHRAAEGHRHRWRAARNGFPAAISRSATPAAARPVSGSKAAASAGAAASSSPAPAGVAGCSSASGPRCACGVAPWSGRRGGSSGGAIRALTPGVWRDRRPLSSLEVAGEPRTGPRPFAVGRRVCPRVSER